MSQKGKDINPRGATSSARQETGAFELEKLSPIREPVIKRNLLMSPEKQVQRQETAIFVPDKRVPGREPVIKTTEKQEAVVDVEKTTDREPVIKSAGSPTKRVTRSTSSSRREGSPETSVQRPSVIAISPKVSRKRKPLVRQKNVEEDDSAPPTPSRTIACVIQDNTPKSGTE